MPRGRKKHSFTDVLIDTPPLPPPVVDLTLPVLPFPLEVPKPPEIDIDGVPVPSDETRPVFDEASYMPNLDKALPKTKMVLAKRPMIEKWWTSIFYGDRGMGKSIHQAKTVVNILEYLDKLYQTNPILKQAIVFSNQRFNKEIETKYLGALLYYWNNAKELRYCPRPRCWKGEAKHRLHGCYIIFDDMATILPADSWTMTPIWMRKMFAQGRHFGIRILANMQDPFAIDVNFRRYTDMAFRFRKIAGNSDPDETKLPIRHIWGMYVYRQIPAAWLWRFGDMSEDEIENQKRKFKRQEEITGEKSLFRDIWKARIGFVTKKAAGYYDTTQDVPEFKPAGYSHRELKCLDPGCDHVKVIHEVV